MTNPHFPTTNFILQSFFYLHGTLSGFTTDTAPGVDLIFLMASHVHPECRSSLLKIFNDFDLELFLFCCAIPSFPFLKRDKEPHDLSSIVTRTLGMNYFISSASSTLFSKKKLTFWGGDCCFLIFFRYNRATEKPPGHKNLIDQQGTSALNSRGGA